MKVDKANNDMVHYNNMDRVLQVNIDDTGGAFSLMYQAQKQLSKTIIFDYYTMDCFKNPKIVDSIKSVGGTIYEASLRTNRTYGHLVLPFKFYCFLRLHNYSIIHIHSDTAWKLLLYAIPAKLAKIKRIIVHSHSSGVTGDFRWIKYLLHLIAKNLLPYFADKLLSCSSEATHWMYVKKWQSRVIVIHNGIDVGRYRFNTLARKTVRNAWGISDREILIGTVGDFSYSKNPEALLKVFQSLLKSYDYYKLVFAGDGNNRRKIEKYAFMLGVADKVLFIGKRNDIECIYSALDIFVMTSRFEGLPMSAVEAQANGLKCILSDRISKEIKILDNCEFISMKNRDHWLSAICDYSRNCRDVIGNHMNREYKRRINASQLVERASFNIQFTGDELMDVYFK